MFKIDSKQIEKNQNHWDFVKIVWWKYLLVGPLIIGIFWQIIGVIPLLVGFVLNADFEDISPEAASDMSYIFSVFPTKNIGYIK